MKTGPLAFAEEIKDAYRSNLRGPILPRCRIFTPARCCPLARVTNAKGCGTSAPPRGHLRRRALGGWLSGRH